MRRAPLIRLFIAIILAAEGTVATASPDKVTICHVPPGNPERAHTLLVSQASLRAHLAHGDYLGACDATKITRPVGPAGATLELTGVGSVKVPPGALAATTLVTLERTQDAATDSTYLEYQALFQSPFRAPFELHLVLADRQPALPCSAQIELPAGFREGLPQDTQPAVFISTRSTSEEDSLEFVNELPSRLVANALQFELPLYCFDHSAALGNRVEARFFIAAGPALVAAPAPGAAPEGEDLAPVAVCAGGLIGFPFDHDPTGTCTPSDPGPCVKSEFGERILEGELDFHPGLDFRAPLGTRILATSDGIVDVIGLSERGAGKRIILRHTKAGGRGDGVTIYMHMLDFAGGLQAGSAVVKGQVIGFVGSTGHSTGPHLHLGYVPNGHVFDEEGLKDPFPCIVQSPPLFDLDQGTEDHTCNLINSSCPTPGCLRAGRGYIGVLSLRRGASPPPAGTSVVFRVNGSVLGAPVPMTGIDAFSDRSFLGVPFRPAPGQTTRLEADVHMPGLPTEHLARNIPIVFDDQVLVKNGQWRIHANQVKRRTAPNRYTEASCALDGVFTVRDCFPQGSVVAVTSGLIFNQGSTCAIPSQTRDCVLGDCLQLDFARRSMSFSGTLGLPLGPCGIGTIGTDMLLPPNFTYDLLTPGAQQSGDGVVTVTYEGTLGAPRIVFSRAWDLPVGLNERETGSATVELVRIDVPAPIPGEEPPVVEGVRDRTHYVSEPPEVSDGRTARHANAGPQFTCSTTAGAVRFRIASDFGAATGLIIYDALGRRVRAFEGQGIQPGGGAITWDGRAESGQLSPSGVYFAKLTRAGSSPESIRFVWIR